MIRAALMIVTVVALTPPLAVLLVLAALLRLRDHPHSVYAWVPRAWTRSLLAAAGTRIVEHGVEHAHGARHVFVANHVGNFDVLALASRLRWIKFVAKAELFRVPFFGPAIRAAGMIPIERANRKAAFGAYTVATQRIEAGASVAVFPEGTRGPSYALRSFKKGPFVLAIQAQAPIIPTVVHGSLEIWPKGARRIRRGTIHIHYLPPIESAGLTYEDRDDLARRVHEAMARCLRTEYGVASAPYAPA